MKMSAEEYFDSCEEASACKLRRIRELIYDEVPNVEERIAWGVPTYYHNGYLMQIAGYKKHIGFYVTPYVIAQCRKELEGFKTNDKNTVQLSLDQPLPEMLLRRMIQLRLKEKMEEKRDDEDESVTAASL